MWIIDFAAKTSFFVSYVVTFLLVLEVVRLVCSDANKREAERLLEAYTRGRQLEKKHEESCELSVEELEHGLGTYSLVHEQMQPPQTPQRRTQRTAMHRTPTSEKTLVSEEKEKKKRSQTPTRRLRKRSDTLNSASTSESRQSSRSKSSSTTSGSRHSSRSHRDSSPDSTTSKSSSNRHASPGFRRSKDASLSLHRLLRQRA